MEKTCANCLHEYQCDWPPEMICDDWIPEYTIQIEKDGETIDQI